MPKNIDIPRKPVKNLIITSIIILVPLLMIMLVTILKPLLVNRTVSYLDEGSLTIYNYSFKLLMLGHMPFMAFITVLFPEVARAHAENKGVSGHFKKRSLILLGVGIFFAIGLTIMADIVIYVAFGLSKLTELEHIKLVRTFRVLVWELPAGALALFFVETLYAQKKLGFVFLYGLTYSCILYFLLEYIAPHNLTGIAAAYISTTWICIAGLGLIILKFFNHSQ